MKLLSLSFWLALLVSVASLFPQQTQARCFFGIWGDCYDRGSSTTRPNSRPQVICSVWCPSGYNRRSVTIGPRCAWYHVGKCVDNTAYIDENCNLGNGQPRCVSGLQCERPAQPTGATCRPVPRFASSDRTHLEKASKKVSARHK